MTHLSGAIASPIVVHGDGVLAGEVAELLGEDADIVRSGSAAPPPWEPVPAGAVYVAPDPHEPCEPGALLEVLPACAYRFGLAALDALAQRGGGRLLYVTRSFASLRASAAFPESAIAGAAIVAVARALAARSLGAQTSVALLAVGLLERPEDDALAAPLAGQLEPGQWIALKQGRAVAPRELGRALAFLLSTRASVLNGAVLAVDSTLSGRLA